MKSYGYILTYIFFTFSSPTFSKSQDTLWLNLQEAIDMACQYSPEAIAARHSFRASYWNWRSYKANLLPSLTFVSDPVLDRTINTLTIEDGTDKFVRRNLLTVDAGLHISQNIPLTGGAFFVNTSLQRIDLFHDKEYSYKSIPIAIGYEQNLFGYNKLKWDKKIEPLRYKEAKKALIEMLELVAAKVTGKFFQLAYAQTSWEIAQINYLNADTLYQFGQGRYEIGTITENEMLQLELNLLTEQTNIMNARIEMDDYIQELRSYLGISDATQLIAIINDEIDPFTVPVEEALVYAYEYNPEPETIKRKRLESESAVAYAKSQREFKADLYVQFGLAQEDVKLQGVYRSPGDQQYVSLGIRLPIIDWGVGRGKVKVAVSNRDKVYIETEQEKNDFEQNVIKMVKQFNLQAHKVAIAYKTDQTAQRRSEVARKLYLLGKSDILDLNASISEKDTSRKAYIQSLYNYWNLYYRIRSITGYDFERNRVLEQHYELLMR